MASTQEKATVSAPSRNASAASESEWTAGGIVAEVSDLSSARSANVKTAAAAAPSALTAVIDSIDRPSPQNQPAVKGIFHDLTNLLPYTHMQR